MNKADFYYKKNLIDILENGSTDTCPRPKWSDGTTAHSKFITQVFESYDLAKKEFPIPTIRNTAIRTGIKEILWIYQKQSNSLVEARKMGINWWEEWNIGDDTIGNRYGHTIKKYDLTNKLLCGLKDDPFSRRHIINLFQYSDLESSIGLYPCAYETMWSVRDVDGVYYLDLTLNQRSNDFLIAGAINKIQYVALQMMVAGSLGYEVGKFCHFVQNLHIYDRHIESAKELLGTESLVTIPYIELVGKKDFYEYTVDDFKIHNTENIPKLKNKLEIAI